MPPLRNPILPGFHPDPSIVRVANTYYIATSTFEWFPGVRIHASSDLATWHTIQPPPLTRASQLDMRGNPDSCGVWAPCLSHDARTSTFYLVYTDVKRKDGSFKDAHNYIVTARDIAGPWSDPVYVNSSGFDPSLFHDGATGKKYFVNMLWDHRQRGGKSGKSAFAGIACQEWDAGSQKLVGERRTIFKGTEHALVEGPHMYKRGGWYYLLTAEGGTSYGHASTLARSRSVWGPFDDADGDRNGDGPGVHPQRHILTAKDAPSAALQKAGHASFVDTPDGEKTYLVHLCGRPVRKKGRCVLGRETSIQECYWADDEWLYVKNGPVPSLWVDVPGTRDESEYWKEKRYTFGGDGSKADAGPWGLDPDLQWLRTPEPERIFRVGGDDNNQLILYGRESIGSWFEQALVARRQTHFSYDAETLVDFQPNDERQFAGLTAYYCAYNFYYLTISSSSEGTTRELALMISNVSWPDGCLDEQPLLEPVEIPNKGKVRLALSIRGGETLQFQWAMEGEDELKNIGPVLDASILSDECGGHQTHGSFTGAFAGVACSDLNGTAMEARFDYLLYRPIKHESDRQDE
ncbi:glycosyl hydrolases family 43-domain-containing protein [Coniella lustricola]|uniref:Glycosyl hydrolases family 43-domain-containing protein n=1 Tax=Coniella lustricola TaxID=2025994 RepID=A0A2T2ZY57_9PEZI|nr:glycosyl hydrolases family 43-domain-containing protein [Coniella lustricola]